MKKWMIALLLITVAGLAVASMSFTAPAAQASSSNCQEPPDCIGGCICEQKEEEAVCAALYEANLIDNMAFSQCMRQARQAGLDCIGDCVG